MKKDSKDRRAQAVEKYKKAVALFKSKEGKTWRQSLETVGCDKKYPFMDLDAFDKQTDIDIVVSDLIGFVGRLGWQKGNKEFVEAITEVLTETRITPMDVSALTNEELCKEFYMRKLHERYDDDGEPAFIREVEMPVEFDPYF